MILKFPFMGQSEESFWKLPGKQRMLLVAAYFADTVKVREEGWNRGLWVDRFLASVGLNPGYAWCAAFVSYCAKVAKYDVGPLRNRARVRAWAEWAKQDNRLGFAAKRGDLFYWLNDDGSGHIGIIAAPGGAFHSTIEGNTNSAGSREGDAVARRLREVAGVSVIRLP